MKLNSAVVFISFAFLIVSSASFAQQRREAPPANVIVSKLQFEALQSSIEAVGTAEALKSVDLFSAAADKVIAIYFSPGEWVTKDQLLLKLDARRQTVAVTRAEILLNDATRLLKRLQQSSDRGAVAQSAIDDAKTAKELAEVALLDAQSDLEDRAIYAPFDGFVGLSDVQVGDRINNQTLVTTLDDRRSLFINFSAPEASIGIINQASEVTVKPWTNRTVALKAKVAQVDSRLSEQDRTIRIRAELDNTDDVYRPGMSFRVNLAMSGEEYAVIPESGLSWGADGAFVWIVIDEKASKVPVQIKQRLKGRVLVEGNLTRSDLLVVEGIQRLRAGQTVSIRAQEQS